VRMRNFVTRILVVGLTTAMLLAAVRIPVATANYSCTGHCLAVERTDYTDVNTTILGAHTKIDTVHISCNNCPYGAFVDNEMWILGDDPNYWVETGISTSGQAGNQVEYFWGLGYKGSNGLPVNVWQPFAVVPSGDYGHPATYWAYKQGAWNSSTFVFQVSNLSATYVITQNNPFTVTKIDMGSELGGTSGASAPNARFSYRYAINTNHNDVGIYGHYYQPEPPDNPPYLGFISGDTDFYTHCC
jgi:hypothetical protein